MPVSYVRLHAIIISSNHQNSGQEIIMCNSGSSNEVIKLLSKVRDPKSMSGGQDVYQNACRCVQCVSTMRLFYQNVLPYPVHTFGLQDASSRAIFVIYMYMVQYMIVTSRVLCRIISLLHVRYNTLALIITFLCSFTVLAIVHFMLPFVTIIFQYICATNTCMYVNTLHAYACPETLQPIVLSEP